LKFNLRKQIKRYFFCVVLLLLKKRKSVLKKILLFFVLSLALNSCFLFGGGGDPKPVVDSSLIIPEFNGTPQIFETPYNKSFEASGIAPSISFPGTLYVNDDSNSKPGLHLYSKDGSYQRFVNFSGTNRDWEDIATGIGPEVGKNYVYIGDIGDNLNIHKNYFIYRCLEPSSNQNSIDNYDKLIYHYPSNESNNAETMMLDPLSKDIYVITKDQINVKVFRLKYPQPVNQDFEAEYLGTIPYWGITAGDISQKGNEILLKTYIAVFYWKIKKGETIFQTLSRTRDVGAPYIQEPQGEAICWDTQAKGYFTISESGDTPIPPKLYYYSKK
jgi:hypothetical protein